MGSECLGQQDAPADCVSGIDAQCLEDAEVFLRWKSSWTGHPRDADRVHESRSEPCSCALGIISFVFTENFLKSNKDSRWNQWCSGILHRLRIWPRALMIIACWDDTAVNIKPQLNVVFMYNRSWQSFTSINCFPYKLSRNPVVYLNSSAKI